MRKKKSSRKQAMDRADAEFNKYIRERDKRCVLCGNIHPQCGHVIPKKNHLNTRWDEENAFGQCQGCNYRHTFDQSVYFDWYVNRFGVNKWEQLYSRSRIQRKYTVDEINNIADKYSEKNKQTKEIMGDENGKANS